MSARSLDKLNVAPNPYSLLNKQLKALLNIEVTMHPDFKERSSWQIMHEFDKVSIIIGKGGANTCFWQYKINGNQSERKYGYPSDLLDWLGAHIKQSHPSYLLEHRQSRKRCLSIKNYLKKEPSKRNIKIYGISRNEKTLIYISRANAVGKLSWIKVQGKSS